MRKIEQANDTPLWSIAAVAKATGITHHTLRAWERRFGFPEPHRLPSGHRRFTAAQVERLRLIARAISLGHKAGNVVPMAPEALRAMLPEAGDADLAGTTVEHWVRQVLEDARAFDRDAIVRSFHHASAAVGVRGFLNDRATPLAEALGEAWAEGRLDIRHEHFVSEILGDELRALRAPLEAGAAGKPVLLATLPAEQHALGLQMAALTVALSGRRVLILGDETPKEEIVNAVGRAEPAAVGVSVSATTATAATTEALNWIRQATPREVAVWVGGSGAVRLRGLLRTVTVVPTLKSLERQLAGLV